DQNGRQMGERRQIAGRTNRSLGRDAGIYLMTQQRHQQAYDVAPHSGMPARQPDDLERKNEAHHLLAELRADAGTVGTDQVALQRRQIGWRNTRAGQLTEAGIDTIDRPAVSNRTL